MLVMFDLVVLQLPAFPVFQPLLADLVAADPEFPDHRQDALKVHRHGLGRVGHHEVHRHTGALDAAGHDQ